MLNKFVTFVTGKNAEKLLTKPRVFFLFFCIGYSVYSASLIGDFIWDDEYQLIYTPITYSVRNIPTILVTGQLDIFYRPALFIYLTIIHHIFGLNPLPFHFFQVLLHVANTFMVFILLKKLLDRKISFLLSLIFLIHPMNVEGIAHISAAGDPISTFFGLIAFHLMLPDKLSFKRMITAGIVMLFSLMGKETALLIICIIVLYRFLFTKHPFIKSFIFTVIPVFLYAFMRFGVAKTYFTQLNFIPIAELSLVERIINIPKIALFYISTFFFPLHLSIAQNWMVRSINRTDFLLPLIIDLFFLVGMGTIVWRNYKKNPGAFKKYLFFFLWLLGGISMYFQIVPLDMTVGERWFYVPMIGLLGFIGIFLKELKIKNRKLILVGSFVYLIIVIMLSYRTLMRNSNWLDDYSLFSHDIRVTQNSFDLEYNYGYQLVVQGRLDEALPHIKKAIKLSPKYTVPPAIAGSIYLRKGDYEKAIHYYNHSLSLDGENYAALYGLIHVFLLKGDNNSALTVSKQALEIFPKDPFMTTLSAIAEYSLGNKEKALLLAKYSFSVNRAQFHRQVYYNILRNKEIDYPRLIPYN